MTSKATHRTHLGNYRAMKYSLCGIATFTLAALTLAMQPASARTLADTHHEFAEARGRIYASFIQAGLPYPPQRISLVTLKSERRVELWANYCVDMSSCTDPWRYVRHYPITAASGHIGPKLKRGDKQVPEGIYRLGYLNPNSRFHLSFKINYPNAWDRAKGKEDKRPDLGDNIFFHGNAKSIGCVAVGDVAIEELFMLVQEVEPHNVKVVIAPYDFRKHKVRTFPWQPKWLPGLYKTIDKALADYPASALR